jgi:hypothetical protein
MVVAFSFLPVFRKASAPMWTVDLVPVVICAWCTSAYRFLENRIDCLYPFRRDATGNSDTKLGIQRSFTASISARAQGPSLRNVIIFIVESLEYSFVGRFNPDYPLSMPWLSEMSNTSAFFSNVQSHPYTTWSTAGLLVTQCGFPHLMAQVSWRRRRSATYDGFEQIPCILSWI